MKPRTRLSKDTIKLYKDAHKNKEVYERVSNEKLLGNESHLGHIFNDESIQKFPIEDNTFPFVFIDTTLRCDYSCNQCYNPVMPRPDMNVDSFKEVINRLPNPIEIRLLGGEPTLHKDFFKTIDIIFEAGHSCYLSTNGYRIGQDIEFTKKLKEHSKKGKMRIHMDFSCGLSERLAEVHHADKNSVIKKLKMLDVCNEIGLGRITIGMVLTRGVNESHMEDVFTIAKRYPKVIREIAYRSQGNVGRYIKDEDGNDLKPYTTNEWLNLMLEKKLTTKKDLSKTIMAGFMDKRCKGKNCCYHYAVDKTLYISWLDFLNDTCWMRGQLREKDGEVLPEVEYMFESLEANDINKFIKVENILQ